MLIVAVALAHLARFVPERPYVSSLSQRPSRRRTDARCPRRCRSQQLHCVVVVAVYSHRELFRALHSAKLSVVCFPKCRPSVCRGNRECSPCAMQATRRCMQICRSVPLGQKGAPSARPGGRPAGGRPPPQRERERQRDGAPQKDEQRYAQHASAETPRERLGALFRQTLHHTFATDARCARLFPS